jgi:hypothetical protein
MGKITVDKIVSLIIEQINAETTDDFAPNEFTFIDSIEKYGDIFFEKNDDQPTEPQPKVEPQTEPETSPNDEVEGSMEAGLESDAASDLDEMARAPKYEVQRLPQPLRIPANLLIPGAKTTVIPRIVSIDPATNQEVEGVVISDEYYMMPNGDRVLRFYNYGEEQKVDRSTRHLRFVVLPEIENKFFSDLPRNVKTGTGYAPTNYDIAPPDETPAQRELRIKRKRAIKEGKAKRFGLFPIINDMFSKPAILDRLDICLIPETWATTQRTEHPTNVELRKLFGGIGSTIDADFYAVRDVLNLNQAINEIMDLRADIAEGRIENEEDPDETFDIKRERQKSSHIPRKHANYKYMNGNWDARQRVHDPEFFKEAGGKTRIYELNSKNIQEGLKELDVESMLHVKGEIVDENYVLTATFSATLNARNLISGEGENRGPLIAPITASLMKPLPQDEDVNLGNFNLVTQPDFFINEGMIKSGTRTGFLPALFNRLGEAILENTDPNDIQQRIVLLAQEAVEENA